MSELSKVLSNVKRNHKATINSKSNKQQKCDSAEYMVNNLNLISVSIEIFRSFWNVCEKLKIALIGEQRKLSSDFIISDNRLL